MKRIVAIVLACTLFLTSSMCVFASNSAASSATSGGSKSVTAEDIEKMQEEIDKLTKEIKKLRNAIAASKSGSPQGNQGGGSPAPTDTRTIQLVKNNAVDWGGTIVAQGGHVEINGGKSNVTFMLGVPNSATLSSANSLAGSLGGSILSCVNVSSTVAFRTAKVNFYVSGVTAGDNVAVYQRQGNKWVQLPTAEIRKDHVVVNMTTTGAIAFIRVPVLATVTY